MNEKSGKAPQLIRHSEAIAEIMLRRPALANRLEPDDLAQMRSYLKECEAEKTLRVLILAAEGRYFSSGYDLGSLGGRAGSGQGGEKKSAFEMLVDEWEKTPIITLAAIQGPVMGGSTDLALASDFRIGTSAVTAKMPAARLGFHLYPGIFRRYVTRLGLNHAKALVLTAASFSCPQLQAMGFLTEVVEEDKLTDRTLELAGQIAKLAPLALRGMKAALNNAAESRMDEEIVRKTMIEVFLSDDCREGIAAWREKREPDFKGR